MKNKKISSLIISMFISLLKIENKKAQTCGLFYLLLLSTSLSIIFSAPSFADFKPTQLESSESNKSSTEATVLSSAEREIHKHALGFGIGQTFLMGRFQEYGDHSITGDLLYTYTASYSFDLLLNAHWSNHEYKEDNVWLRGYSMSIKARTFEFDAFSPFYLGGLGFYRPQIEDGRKEKISEEKFTFGANIGAGVDLRLNSSVIVGIMGQLHKPFDIRQEEMSTVSGSYFKLLITSMFIF